MKKSVWHQKVEGLEARLIKTAPQWTAVREELHRCEAGFKGERRVVYYLAEMNESFRILHDIRLPFPNGFTFFQMDTIVICPSIILILESKNLTGHLIFNRRTKQLIRGSQTFDDPITQVQRHKRGLEHWLEKPVPILPAAVISHPNVRVELVPEDSPDHTFIIHAPEIPAKVDEFLDEKRPVLTAGEVHELARSLQKHHQPYDPDILKKFNIEREQIQNGIRCPACKTFNVIRSNRKWCCQSCGTVSKDAHLTAMKEYVLLFGLKVTNRELRNFLNIKSESIVQKLLKRWGVSYEGTTKDRVYMLPEEWKNFK